MDDEDFVDLFVEEVGEHLEALNQNLLALEENNWQPETVNSLMRAAHTIKGAAMLMNFEPMANLAHSMEDRLRAEEKKNRPVPTAMIDLLLAGARIVQEMVGVAVQQRDFSLIEDRDEWAALTKEILEADIPDEDDSSSDAVGPSEEDMAALLEADLAAAKKPKEAPGTAPKGATKATAKKPAKKKPAKKKATKKAAKKKKAAKDAPPDEAKTAPRSKGQPKAPKKAAPPAPPLGELKEFIKIPVEKVDQLNDLVGELLIYQAKLEQKEESLRDMTRRLETLVTNSERARLVGLAPLPPEVQDIQEDLTEYVEELSGDLVELNYLSADIRRRSLQIRMLPASTMLQEFKLAVRDLRRRLKKEAELLIEGGDIELDKRLLEELRPAILHIIRNCMDHGIERPDERAAAGKPRQGQIRLRIRVEGARVHISIEDDGKGMDADRIRERAVEFGLIGPETASTLSNEEALYLVMQPGFSTSDSVTDVSGRGVGMDVVRTQVEDLKGTIRIETTPGKGTQLLLDLPLTLSTAQVLMIEVSGQTIAIPIGYVEETLLLDPRDIFREGGLPVFRLRNRTISLYPMDEFLAGLETRSDHRNQFLSVVILRGRGQRVGFQVARFLEQSEVVVKTLGSFIQSVSYISGATILGDGKPALILDVPDLLASLALSLHRPSEAGAEGPGAAALGLGSNQAARILVVDDSITTRALQKGILEGQGYQVYTAAGGPEALRLMQLENFDLVMTDVEMPEMDGFELTRRIREDPQFTDLPIVICSVKGSEEDRIRGLRLGAQAYLVKREFNQDEFCRVVQRLIG